MGKNVAVYVDVANIFYAAKAAGVDIDYVTLLKSASAGRDLVRAYAYTGLDPDNENQRNFHDFLRRHGYKVVSKDIRKYGDGKVKANLDIELVVDMMKTARNLDIAIVVSGDGDFAPAIRAVQEMGVRVEVISFRGNTSSDLIEVADLFTDITQLARVEKGSRSGRRVADDDADLSMTEVPDKQTEGTGVGRGTRGGRGRGRGRSEGEPATPVRTSTRARRGSTSTNGSSTSTVLPGERLSGKSGGLSEADLASAEVFTLDDVDAAAASSDGPQGAGGDVDESRDAESRDDAGRRRRRRGGRGRGRGRGRDETPAVSGAPVTDAFEDDEDEEDEAPIEAPRPRSTPFGSVWDSQLGTTAAPTNLAPLSPDDEDFDEPEIPEYLIAEQRRANAPTNRGGGRGPRGGRSAYQSAMDRERYGGGRSGGINRYPDVSGRTPPSGNRSTAGRSYDRPTERRRESGRPASSAEPWSEVPPELEAMLRAQVGQKPSRPSDVARPSSPERIEATDAIDAQASPLDTADVAASADGAPASKAAPKRRTTRKSTATASADEAPTAETAGATATKRRATRKPTTGSADAATSETATPKRRAARSKATTSDATTAAADGVPTGDAAAGDAGDGAATTKRRTTRKTTTTKTAS
ncbi:MAG: NYN domain-containing protein [Chloroflexota bacterium]